jgi:hypothetical protein
MAVAVVRSAINAGNSAYDRLNVTASHLIEIAEANMSAASQATFKAAANAAKVSRKAA